MNLKYKVEPLSVQDYLEGELLSQIKHEYIDGQVYAMAGASSSHNRIVSNLGRELGNPLRQSSCEPFVSDMKVRVIDDFFYPDVLVACNHTSNDYGVTDAPLIIVEVLSKATRKIDHTLKRLAYQQLDSLQEYVVIEQDVVDVDVIAIGNRNIFFLGDKVDFESIDLRLAVATIYERVENEDMLNYLKTPHEKSA